MNIAEAYRALTATTAEAAATDKRNELKSSFWGSKRFLLVLALGALIVLNLVPLQIFHDLSLILVAYLIGESAVSGITAWGNTRIKLKEIELDLEYTKLEQAKKTP